MTSQDSTWRRSSRGKSAIIEIPYTCDIHKILNSFKRLQWHLLRRILLQCRSFFKSWPVFSFVIDSGAQAIPLRPDQRTRIQCAWEPSPHQTGVCFYRLPSSWCADWKEWQPCGGRYRVSLDWDLYRQCWWLRSLSLCRQQRGRSLQVELYLWDQTFRFVSQHSYTLFLRRVDFKLLRINPGLVFWKE